MTIKSKSSLVRLDIDDDILLASIRFYRADGSASPPNHARVVCSLTNGAQVDRPLSDYASLTSVQKGQLGNIVNLLWNETIILEGYT